MHGALPLAQVVLLTPSNTTSISTAEKAAGVRRAAARTCE